MRIMGNLTFKLLILLVQSLLGYTAKNCTDAPVVTPRPRNLEMLNVAFANFEATYCGMTSCFNAILFLKCLDVF